ncbi:MAG: hypothetical protein ABI378_11720 [Chitinophagaceae bacterium]
MTEAEQEKLKALKAEIKILEEKLQQAQLKEVALDTLINVAERQFNVEIRKEIEPEQ